MGGRRSGREISLVMMSEPGPRVATSIPGPLSAEYLARQGRRESNARSYPRRLPIAIKRGFGSFVEDVDGNVFIDFLTGAGALPLGHSHPAVVEAVEQQIGTFVHGLDFPTPIKDEFTELQLSMLPDGMREQMKVHFCGPTGANGVEAAIKLCKIATGRSEVIAFHGGYHGGTAGAMSVSGEVSIKAVVANDMPGVHFFPYSYCVRCPIGLTPDACATNCATYLERALVDPYGGIPKPAAVLLEMVQGEGGGVPATYEFVQRVRKVTADAGIPLLVDEVQTGCGRTGTWFAFEQYNIQPDVIILSKALSGIGLPISIVIYDAALDRWPPGAHTGTFRGNQLAFAAAVASIGVMRDENVLANVRERGQQLGDGLRMIAKENPWVIDVRGRGLMWAVELGDVGSDAPPGRYGTAAARGVQAAALRNGLILEVGGREDCVLRLLPPLNITESLVDRALDVLRLAFAEVCC